MLWKKDEGADRFSVDEASLHRAIQRQSRRAARRVLMRDWLELTVGLACGFLFFYEGAIDDPYQWDWILLALGCWFVSAVFIRERVKSRETAPERSDSIRDTLRKSLRAVERQLELQKHVLWWYCAPVIVPLLIVTYRSEAMASYRTEYVGLVVAVVTFIVILNRWFARAKLEPKRASIERLLAEVEDP